MDDFNSESEGNSPVSNNDLKFYLLALYAKKLRPEHVAQRLIDNTVAWEIQPGVTLSDYLETPYSLWAMGMIARSEDEARDRGMLLILERCPWQDGWIDHHVSLNTVSQHSLDQICEHARGEGNGSVENSDEWPDVIMIAQNEVF